MLYDIFIYPIEHILKIVFELSYLFTGSYIISTVLLSLIVSIVLLPFYYWADNLQNKERAILSKLNPTIEEFKSVYSGWKLHAIISTYYKQNNYHPIYSLRSLIGLLIQLPFFIAAYHFLSTYQPIIGIETWLFKDLGAPDSWVHLGSLQINIMPFIMTAINIISGFIFTYNMTKSEKIQTWILSLVFLVLLYNSPSLLVLYWTMNNIFSLLKSIIEKKFKSEPIFLKQSLKEAYTSPSELFMIAKNKINDIMKHTSFVEILFLILVLYIYLISIIYIVPNGVNKVFAIVLKNMIFDTSIIIILLAGFTVKSYRLHHFEMPKRSDFLLTLLPLTPIVQYIILNQDTMTTYDSLYILVITCTISIIFIILLPILLSILASRILFMSLGIAILTVLFYMPLLSRECSWYIIGDWRIQWSILLLIFLIILYEYKKNHKILKILISIIFILNFISISLPLLNKNSTIDLESNSKRTVIAKIKQSNFSLKPDIFLLIYDAYSNSKTMTSYGIDNKSQEEYLKEVGFKIYEDTYSIGGASLESISTMLNMSKNIIDNEYSRFMVSGHTNTYSILRSQGYQLSVILENAYMFGKNKPTLDMTYPKTLDKGYEILWNSILMGEFTSSANEKFSQTNGNTFIKTKREYMKSNIHPKFLYTHIGPGHSPYATKCRVGEKEQYSMRLKSANIEMKKDIEAIVKNNPDALIIIAGDHGPYIVGNCLMYNGFEDINNVKRLNIQDTFGVFIAIKWPKSLVPIDTNITVLQDVFPSVFSTLLRDKTIFDTLKVVPDTNDVRNAIAGVKVKDGIIKGGLNDGELLFLEE